MPTRRSKQLDVNRPEVDAIMKLYIQRNVYFDATVSAYGYWYNPKDERIFTTWMDEQSFLTPHAREVANIRKKPQVEQFKRLYDVKQREVKKFYDAGGAKLITSGTDHPSWGEYLSGFSTHRELQTFVQAGIPAAAAIKMATINAAHAMRMGDQLGTIETEQAGRPADRSRQSAPGHQEHAQRAARDARRQGLRRGRTTRLSQRQDGSSHRCRR